MRYSGPAWSHSLFEPTQLKQKTHSLLTAPRLTFIGTTNYKTRRGRLDGVGSVETTDNKLYLPVSLSV